MRWKKQGIANSDRPSGSRRTSDNAESPPSRSDARSPLPPDAVDLIIDDAVAIEAARTMHRADSQNKVPTHIYRHTQVSPNAPASARPDVEEVYGADQTGETEMLSEDNEPIVGTEEVLINIEQEVADDESPVQSGAGGSSEVSTPYDQDNPWA
jgi:hypothetical protein